ELGVVIGAGNREDRYGDRSKRACPRRAAQPVSVEVRMRGPGVPDGARMTDKAVKAAKAGLAGRKLGIGPGPKAVVAVQIGVDRAAPDIAQPAHHAWHRHVAEHAEVVAGVAGRRRRDRLEGRFAGSSECPLVLAAVRTAPCRNPAIRPGEPCKSPDRVDPVAPFVDPGLEASLRIAAAARVDAGEDVAMLGEK